MQVWDATKNQRVEDGNNDEDGHGTHMAGELWALLITPNIAASGGGHGV
jgi:hypothetical protein